MDFAVILYEIQSRQALRPQAFVSVDTKVVSHQMFLKASRPGRNRAGFHPTSETVEQSISQPGFSPPHFPSAPESSMLLSPRRPLCGTKGCIQCKYLRPQPSVISGWVTPSCCSRSPNNQHPCGASPSVSQRFEQNPEQWRVEGVGHRTLGTQMQELGWLFGHFPSRRRRARLGISALRYHHNESGRTVNGTVFSL